MVPTAQPAADGVAVLGCGLLGSAVARVLAASGEDVHAWNRTPTRAEALRSPGVTPVASVQDAVAAAGLLLVAVTTYDDVATVLGEVDDLSGRTIVTLSTGVPDDARGLSATVMGRGGSYLDAAVLGYPDDLGESATVVVFAGDKAAWEAHRAVLGKLAGGASFVSEDVTAANAVDVAATGAFYTVAYGALVEAATYAAARDIDPRDVIPAARAWLRILARNLEEVATAVATGQHDSDQATVDVYLEAATAWREELARAGLRGSLMAAEEENLARARAGGHGQSGFSAQSLTMRSRG